MSILVLASTRDKIRSESLSPMIYTFFNKRGEIPKIGNHIEYPLRGTRKCTNKLFNTLVNLLDSDWAL